MSEITGVIVVLLAQWASISLPECHLLDTYQQQLWIETSVDDFRDGLLDPAMYVSARATLDPDSGSVEFFARFDVNNDGYFDLACADDSGPYLHLYFGTDSGYYPANSRRYPVPGGGNIDLADLNIDGYAELIHSGWRSGHVTIYWGTATGPSPVDTTWLLISGQSEAVAVYDLDRNSYLDILAGSDNGNIYIFWGSPDGYATAKRSSVFLGGSVGHNIEVVDFDRDGYGDIAASLWTRNRCPIVYWGPNRLPRYITWLPVSPNNPHGITVADLNTDDWLDIVFTGYDTVTTTYIYYGSEAGFSTTNRELIHPGQCYGGSAAVTCNADKTLDLVFFRGDWGSLATARPRVFFNRLDTIPHFSDARSTEIGEHAFNASGGFTADLNYDGYIDLFVNNMLPDSQSYILWGPSFLSYTELPSDRDHHGVWREPGSIYTREFSARYISSVYDLGEDSVVRDGTCSWVASEPPGSSVTISVRGGNTPIPDSSWTDFFGVAINGGPLPYPVMGKRFLQYQASFFYNRPCHLPHLERIAMLLTRQPSVDVAVQQILAPSGTIDSGRATVPAVIVRNNRAGTPAIATTLRIGTDYTAFRSDTLSPFAIDTLFFNPWIASIPGNHAVRCSVHAEFDEEPANDTLSTTITVRVLSDATPLAIVSPPQAAESGSVHIPVVIVANRGTRTDTVPVRLWIGSSYHETAISIIPPACTDTIRFPNWTASPAGNIPVRCSTALARDDSTYNDTLSSAVNVFTRIDAATIAILTPADTADSGISITPSARIANLGTSTAAIPVRFRIGNNYDITEIFTIPASETTTISFPYWTASPPGTHVVSCSTMLAGDTLSSNNHQTTTVTVITRLDATAVAIVTPNDTVDSGEAVIPTSLVGNFSTGARRIPVWFRIGEAYCDTVTTLIEPGTIAEIRFRTWTAAPLGIQTVRCSTMLDGDQSPENDAITATTFVRLRIDAAAERVLAPSGPVDSGATITPLAEVANLGGRSAPVQVHFWIGQSYYDSTTVLIPPESTVAVAFSDWAAGQLGTFIARCSVALAGDIFSENDTASSSVIVGHRHDVGCYQITAPWGVVDSGTLNVPGALIRNYGTVSETFPVWCFIEPEYADSQEIELAPGDSALVTFASWVASPTGRLTVRCSTALSTDTFPQNDQYTDSVLVVSHADVAVTDIYAPAGVLDSGTVLTPCARVCNYGSSPVLAPVRLRIGGNYDELKVKYLAIGGKDTVCFPEWIASPLGTHVVTCSTELIGDEHPENDFRYGSVRVITDIDAGVEAILAPLGTIDSGTPTIPAAVIASYGCSPAVVPVRMRIGQDYDSTVIVRIAPGASDTVSFPVWISSPTGAWVVNCSTALALDSNNCNDRQIAKVRVVTRHDVACIEIVSPPPVVDSGIRITPVAIIGNYGTSTTEVPVFMRIGTDYLRSRRKLLSSGERDTVTFPAWSAHPLGYVPVTCSVALHGDEVTKNNAASTSVYVQSFRDAATLTVLAPCGPVDSGHLLIPKARIANYGQTAVTIPVEMRVGSFYRSRKEKTLPPGGADTVLFDIWPARQLGRHTVSCSTMLAYDNNPANDRQESWVIVEWTDAACIRIVSPAELARAGDTVVPVARVRNLSTAPQQIPAVFRVGLRYAELSCSDSLLPGDSAELEFAPLIIPVGTTVITCSAALHRDMYPANNRIEGLVLGTERALELEPDSAAVVLPGGTVYYRLLCRNTGNADDTADISSSGSRPGWQVAFFDSTGTALLADHDHNGIPDLGHLPAGGVATFTVLITAPADELGDVADSTIIRASSGQDPRAGDTARLTTTVLAIANLMIEPDQFDTAAAGVTHIYSFRITNLGNVEDLADITMSVTRNGWLHELTDAAGNPLGDRNRNRQRDIGPIPARGGSIELQLRLTPDRWASIGQRDTTMIAIRSFEDEKCQDAVRAVTEINGSVSALIVEPDQTATVDIGGACDLLLWVETAGSQREVVDIAASIDLTSWTLSLWDGTTGRELVDTDGNGKVDVGYVWPETRVPFVIRVNSPSCAAFADIQELPKARVLVTATLAGSGTDLRDSALISIQSRPRFEAHNYDNPFHEQTRFILSTPVSGRVSLGIYNRLGEPVRQLIDRRNWRPGVYSVVWDGTDEQGRRLAPGIYIYVFEVFTNTGRSERLIGKAILR